MYICIIWIYKLYRLKNTTKNYEWRPENGHSVLDCVIKYDGDKR